MWEALEEICGREGWTIHELSSMVDRKRRRSALTAAVRVFALDYFRAATTEAGHARAGHGRMSVAGHANLSGHGKRVHTRANGHRKPPRVRGNGIHATA
jgi:predicted DNA-binding ribbon-helix-helix protein